MRCWCTRLLFCSGPFWSRIT